MLIDRFPFLSLVPQATLTEHLLDRPLARIRATITRTEANKLTLEILPKTDVSCVLERLRGHKIPYMEVERSYSVEIDEAGELSSSPDAELTSTIPVPIEFLLDHVHEQLCGLVRQYAGELASFPAVEIARECMRGNAVHYLNFLRAVNSIPRAFGPPPRVRAVCLSCFQREAGIMLSLQHPEDSNQQMLLGRIKSSSRVLHAWQVCMGEPFSPEVFPLFIIIPHEQLGFVGAYYKLYEAGTQRCLQEVYASERDIFIGGRLSKGQAPVES